MNNLLPHLDEEDQPEAAAVPYKKLPEEENDADGSKEDEAGPGPGKKPDSPEEADEEEKGPTEAEALKDLFAALFGMRMNKATVKPEDRKKVFDGLRPSLEAIGAGLRKNQWKKVVILSGAGLSTAAGIPDFRSPEKGLYALLKPKFPELEAPEDMFSIQYFRKDPEPFYKLCREMDLHGTEQRYSPTIAHYLSALFAKKGILQRCYTQNIDGLDRRTGLDPDLLVEAHGGGSSAHCTRCDAKVDFEAFCKDVDAEKIPKCARCGALVKPTITFFGESLPDRFHVLSSKDMEACDLVIVLGTSLTVAPFCQLPQRVRPNVPRLIINLTEISDPYGEFSFKKADNFRDVMAKMTCDEGVIRMCKMAGWEKDLEDLVGKKLPEIPEKEEEKQEEENKEGTPVLGTPESDKNPTSPGIKTISLGSV